MQIHACLLALHTGARSRWSTTGRSRSSAMCTATRPRCVTNTAPPRTGGSCTCKARDRARRRRLRLELDGRVRQRRDLRHRAVRRAPTSAIDSLRGLHQQPALRRDARVRRRPGRFAYEAQMDKLAAVLGMDAVELRIAQRDAARDADADRSGRPRPAPVAELLERVRAMPLPPAPDDAGRDLRELPGGVSNSTHGEGVCRGVGYAVGIKNVGFSEGFDDYSTARVRLAVDGGEPLVEVHTAAVEVGQGLVTVLSSDRQDRAGRRSASSCARPTPRWAARVTLGVAPDLRDRRRGQGRVQAVAGADWTGRRPPERIRRPGRGQARPALAWPSCSTTRHRGDGRVAAPARTIRSTRDRPGRRPRAVRVRRSPGGRRRGHGARPGQGGRDRDGAGCRQGDEPAGASRARSRAAPPRASAWR